MREIAEQLLSEFGLITVRGDEVGERADYVAAELIAMGQERCGCGSESDAIAFERLERRAACRLHCNLFLERTPFGHFTRFAIARLAQPETGLFRCGRLVTGLLTLAIGMGTGF